MKKYLITLLIIVFAGQIFAQNSSDTIISNNTENLKLKVLYFHVTHRCKTCVAIEANVRKTVNDIFSEELKNGVVDLYILNCELDENKALVEKYNAYGSTLAITPVKNGKDQDFEDLSNFGFSKAHNQELFIAELKTKMEKYLNN